MKKRLKLPNGYGSVALRGDSRRRQPYVVKITIDGRQHAIGYTTTYEEGLTLLAEYHKDPALYNPNKITFAQVYALMAKERYPRMADVTAKNYASAYKRCKNIANVEFIKLRAADLQQVIADTAATGCGNASQKKVRQIMHHCYEYAIKYGIISAAMDYSNYVDIDAHTVRCPKKPFNTRQLNRVRNLITSNHPLANWASCVVMMCYAGTRPSEFINILKTDVKLRQRYFMIRDSKTEAGKNRLVPISKKTLPLFEQWMSRPGKTLIADPDGQPLNYRKFKKLFDKVMDASRCHHTPHECRHTCATWLDNVGANDTAIKRILGHACKDVTKRVYTHKTITQLRKAIDLI